MYINSTQDIIVIICRKHNFTFHGFCGVNNLLTPHKSHIKLCFPNDNNIKWEKKFHIHTKTPEKHLTFLVHERKIEKSVPTIFH